MLSDRKGQHPCDLWSHNQLEDTAAAAGPYVPLCENRLYLRVAVREWRSNLE
jgi:hypothetical protein